MTFNTNYHDTGLWGVYAVADKDCAMDDLAWAIMEVRGRAGSVQDGQYALLILSDMSGDRIPSIPAKNISPSIAGGDEAGV